MTQRGRTFAVAPFALLLLCIVARPADATDRVFASPLRIELLMEKRALDALKTDARKYASATITINASSYTNVGLRLKGMGGFRQLDERPSFALKFNELVKGQKFGRLSKFLLNNCAQDPSYVSEALCNELFAEAGVPAPSTTFARVRFNGRDLGVYSVAEAVNEPFLRRHFRDGDGNLYEGVAQDIAEGLDQDNGEASDQSDLKALAEAANMASVSQRWERLQQLLDIDQFTSFVAMEVLIWHWDGYTMNRSNYRIYNPSTGGNRENRGSGGSSNVQHSTLNIQRSTSEGTGGKIVFIPHGLDQTFRDPHGSIWPEMTSVLVRGVLQTPEGRRKYREKLHTLATNLFQVSGLTNRLARLADQVRPLVSEVSSNALEEWQIAFAAYQRQVVRRAESVHAQLAVADPEVLHFDTNGVARISGWQPKRDWNEPELMQTGPPEGGTPNGNVTLLRIRANGPSAGTWRSRLFLEPGRYRFEARVKTSAVVPLQDSPHPGAGIRLSGSQRTNKLVGTSDWTTLSHEFQTWAQDVELVCELRASKGEVFFSLDSLKLIRLD